MRNALKSGRYATELIYNFSSFPQTLLRLCKKPYDVSNAGTYVDTTGKRLRSLLRDRALYRLVFKPHIE